MKFTRILTAFTAATLLVGCSDKEDPTNPVNPTPGAEVQFGANLDGESLSRTIYGEESNNQFPILWLNGDEVKVMSPECSVTQGLYSVNLGTSETGEQGGSLVKQGDAGVQWGNTPTANFFSVYPAEHVTSMTPASRTVKCHFIHNQNDPYTKNGSTLTAKADMKAGFLYAATYGAENGKSVNLLYKPLSTALRFTLTGPNGQTNDRVNISRITLKAPNDQVIAGDFTLTFPESEGEPTITPAASADGETGHNVINIISRVEGGTGFLTLERGESIELNAFLLLANEVTLSDDWSLEVVLSNNVSFVKKLGNADAENGSKTLVPGQIHRLKAAALPALNIPADLSTYDPSNWMVNIPRNTYLSEISIPGSWNSMNKDFQTATGSGGLVSLDDLTNQYGAGVRAFHLDTRWKNATNRVFWTTATNGANPGPPTLNDLAIANGGTTYPVYERTTLNAGVTPHGDVLGRVMAANTTTFADALGRIVSLVQPDEYLVVMCTYAQGSYNNPAKTWMQAISDVCAGINEVYDAKQLSPTTVVNNVLGSVIVIVNCEGKISEMDLPKNSKCLFVNAPLTVSSGMFGDGSQVEGGHNYNADLLYYTSSTTSVSTGITLNNTQAQITSNNSSGITTSRGYAPTLAERKTTAESIYKDFRKGYNPMDENYVANKWMYVGLGGYLISDNSAEPIAESYTTLANNLNGWIDTEIVNNMSSTPTGTQTGYFPVGIVLMNFVTDEAGKKAANDILQLNNMFQKAFDDKLPAFPDQGGTTPTNSPADYSVVTNNGGNAWNMQ